MAKKNWVIGKVIDISDEGTIVQMFIETADKKDPGLIVNWDHREFRRMMEVEGGKVIGRKVKVISPEDPALTRVEFIDEGGHQENGHKGNGLSGAVMGLDTLEERQHALAMALHVVGLARNGGPMMRVEARGYLRAIRDLAVDEGATDLAREMEKFLLEFA